MRRWRTPIYDKPLPAREVLANALNISTDEAGEIMTALIEGGYGIAPRWPTNGMLAAYLEATDPPKHHESVITALGKARKRWQAMLAQGTAMAMSYKHVSPPVLELLPEDVRARIVGQAITDAHDTYVKSFARIGSNPFRFSDDDWKVAMGRAAIQAVEKLP
jgi:hypothetical protein